MSFLGCSRKPWVPSTCASDLRKLLSVPLRSQGHCGVIFLSREGRDLGVAFQAPPGSQASFHGEAKDSALLSSRDAGLLEPPERPQGSPASSSVWREDPGLLSRPCRTERRGILWRWRGPSGLRWVWRNGRGPHLEGRQELSVKELTYSSN